MAIYACGKVQLWCAAMALLEDSAIYLHSSFTRRSRWGCGSAQ